MFINIAISNILLQLIRVINISISNYSSLLIAQIIDQITGLAKLKFVSIKLYQPMCLECNLQKRYHMADICFILIGKMPHNLFTISVISLFQFYILLIHFRQFLIYEISIAYRAL